MRQFGVVKSLLAIAVASYLEASLAVVLHWSTADSGPVSAGVLLTVSHSVGDL